MRILETNREFFLDFGVLSVCRAIVSYAEWLPRGFLRKLKEEPRKSFESPVSSDFHLRFLETCAKIHEIDPTCREEISEKLLIESWKLAKFHKWTHCICFPKARELCANLLKIINHSELNGQIIHFFLLLISRKLVIPVRQAWSSLPFLTIHRYFRRKSKERRVFSFHIDIEELRNYPPWKPTDRRNKLELFFNSTRKTPSVLKFSTKDGSFWLETRKFQR